MSGELDVAREHPELADWDAAYVLGALSPADRRRFEHHLEACGRCRTAVAELSGLPGLLAAVPLERVGPEADNVFPADLLPRLATAADRSRRRSRIRYGLVGGLVAAALVVVGVGLAWPRDPDPSSPSPSATQVAIPLRQVTANPLAVDVTLISEPWGTRVDLDCRFAGDGGAPGPDKDYDYGLFITNRAGVTMAGPTWTYGPATSAEPVGTSKWPVDQIAAVEVRGGDGTVLLRATR